MTSLKKVIRGACDWALAIGYLLLLFGVGFVLLIWEGLKSVARRKSERIREPHFPKALPAPKPVAKPGSAGEKVVDLSSRRRASPRRIVSVGIPGRVITFPKKRR